MSTPPEKIRKSILRPSVSTPAPSPNLNEHFCMGASAESLPKLPTAIPKKKVRFQSPSRRNRMPQRPRSAQQARSVPHKSKAPKPTGGDFIQNNQRYPPEWDYVPPVEERYYRSPTTLEIWLIILSPVFVILYLAVTSAVRSVSSVSGY